MQKTSHIISVGILSQFLTTEGQTEQITKHLDSLNVHNQVGSRLIGSIQKNDIIADKHLGKTAFFKGPSNVKPDSKTIHLK